jgi:hypothetical protein
MWHFAVFDAINITLSVFALVIGLVALIHCALQRADAFSAIGTLQKPAWLAILGVATLIVLCIAGSEANTDFGAGDDRIPLSLLFNLIALGASALYLLDVRPGLRDISNGRGPW